MLAVWPVSESAEAAPPPGLHSGLDRAEWTRDQGAMTLCLEDCENSDFIADKMQIIFG